MHMPHGLRIINMTYVCNKLLQTFYLLFGIDALYEFAFYLLTYLLIHSQNGAKFAKTKTNAKSNRNKLPTEA